MIESTDANHQITKYDYDAAGNLWKVVQPGDAFSAARSTEYAYDRLNRQISATLNPGGFVTTTKYDAAGNVIEKAGPLFKTATELEKTTSTFDARNRVRSTTDAEGNTTTFAYDAAGNRIRQTDPRGSYYTTDYVYDGANRLVRTTRAAGTPDAPQAPLVDRFEYDGAGNLITLIDARGAQFATNYTYDAADHLLSVQKVAGTPGLPVAQFESYTYDAVGNRITYTDPRGDAYRTTYTYDAQNNLTSTTLAAGTDDAPKTVTESWLYDAENLLVRHVGAGGDQFVTLYARDGLGQATKVTDALGREHETTYDRFGNVVAEVNVHGGVTTSAYDRLNRVVRRQQSDNSQPTTYQYATVGNVTTVIDPRNNSTIYTYDGLKRLKSVEDSYGNVESYEYDAAGNRIRVVDRRGTASRTDFDAQNRVVRVVAAEGVSGVEATTRYEYDVLGHRTATIDPRGSYYRTEFTFDNLGRMFEMRTPAGAPNQPGLATPGYDDQLVTKYQFDAKSRLIAQTSPRGDFYTTTYTFDRLGNQTSVTSQVGTPEAPQLAITTMAYDDAGRVVESVDALGHRSTFTYDLLGRRKSQSVSTDYTVNNPSGELLTTWGYEETSAGYEVTVRDPLRSVLSVSKYDPFDRLMRLEQRGVLDSEQNYDDNGNLVEKRIGADVTRYRYDKLNRLEKTLDEADNTITNAYDANGNLIRVFDAKGNPPAVYEYDARNRRYSSTTPGGETTTTDFDLAGNTTRVIDDAGNVTSYTFDALNRQLTESNSFGTRTTQYDQEGHAIRYQDRDGRTTRYTIDGGGRTIGEQWLNAGGDVFETIATQYDALGRMTGAHDADSSFTIQYTPDGTDRILRQTTTIDGGTPVTIDYAPDNINRPTSMAVRSGAAAPWMVDVYAYDSNNGRLSSIVQSGAVTSYKRVDFDYSTQYDGQYSTVSRFDGPLANDSIGVTTYGFDSRGNVNLVRHQDASNSLVNQYLLTYDANGLLATKNDRYDQAVYTHSADGQLTSVTHTDSRLPNETYGYDAMGNRTSTAQQPSGFSTGAGNRLQSDGRFNYSYDNEGNLIRETNIAT
ncbi:MAG TPA: hypothetical protein PLV92_10730, partial [Pirellulaceae bacterium]|nr:hypothetical protein [Pirellulaceae bacterium]